MCQSGAKEHTTKTTYDEAGRQVKTQTPFYLDANNCPGYTGTKTYYNLDGSVSKVKQQNNAINAGQTSWSVTEFTYDSMGRTVMEEAYEEINGVANNSRQYTQWFYDVKGRLAIVITGLHSQVDVTFTYDSTTGDILSGNVTGSEVCPGCGRADHGTLTDPDNEFSVTSYTYDFYGNLLSYTNAEGDVESYTYNELTGQLMTKTLANGGTTAYTYDNKGNVKTETAVNPDQTQTITTTFFYNIGGQLTDVTDSSVTVINGVTTTATIATLYAYDYYGSVSSETYTQNGNVIVKAYAYEDGTGELKTVTIKVNNVTKSQQTYTYNAIGKLTEVYEAYGNARVNLTYDPVNGELTQESYGAYAANYVLDSTGIVVKDSAFNRNAAKYLDDSGLVSFQGNEYSGNSFD